MTDTPSEHEGFSEAAIDQFASDADWSKLFSPLTSGRDLRGDPTDEEWEAVNRVRWGVEVLYEDQKARFPDFLQRYDSGTQDITVQLDQQGFDTLDLRVLHTLTFGLILIDHFITQELHDCGLELVTERHARKHFSMAESVMAFWLRQRLIEAGAPAPHEPVEAD